MKKITLVKYNTKLLSKKEAKEYVNRTFANMGKIKNMPGHNLCIDINTSEVVILHPESLIELTEDEV